MHHQGFLVLLFLLALISCQFTDSEDDRHSRLWGKNGELWSPSGRITDYSFAGYQMGKDIPKIIDPQETNVQRDFGAVGDGMADDTDAFANALAAKQHGVIFIPPGRFKITRPLFVTKSSIVLRGAGPGKTILYFPRPLVEALKPQDLPGGQDPRISWGKLAGYLWIQGVNWPSITGEKLADVISPSLRGEFTLRLSDTSALREGQTVIVTEEDQGDDSLWRHLHGDESVCCKPDSKSPMASWYKPTHTFLTRIKSIQKNTIDIENPLVVDVKPDWKAAIHAYLRSIEEVGIEDLSLEFPPEPFPPHHLEAGRNAIYFGFDTVNSWVRNVAIRNAETAVGVIGGKFITLDTITLDADRAMATTHKQDISTFPITGFHAGHIGVWLAATQGVLTRNIRFNTTFIHDLSVRHQAHGNVFSNISGIDINFDHHRTAPHNNLYSNIDVGAGSRLWASGGPAELGPHSGAWNTYWNIRARRSLAPTPAVDLNGKQDWGPEKLNFIGFTTTQSSVLNLSGKWFENIPPHTLLPTDLHQAQVERRVSKR